MDKSKQSSEARNRRPLRDELPDDLHGSSLGVPPSAVVSDPGIAAVKPKKSGLTDTDEVDDGARGLTPAARKGRRLSRWRSAPLPSSVRR